MELKKVSVKDIIPYDNNPRKNDNAVDAVMESIKQCGYIAPIITDEDMVVLAGHTRLKAIKRLGWRECNVEIIKGLTEEQKRKYRILDNKVGELASHEIDFSVDEKDTYFIRGLDAQKEVGKAIFGSGFLLSEKAAAEKAADCIPDCWELSEREKEIVRSLG